MIQVSSLKVRKQVRRSTIVCWAQVGSHPLWAGPGVTQWEESHSREKGVQEGPEEGGGSSSQKKVIQNAAAVGIENIIKQITSFWELWETFLKRRY